MPILMSYKEIDEVYLGLNDLHKSLNLDFMFEILAYGLVDNFVFHAKKYKKSYGFGGITKLGSGKLCSDLVLAENCLHGCQLTIISRELQNLAIKSIELYNAEILKIQKFIKEFSCDEEQKLSTRETIIRLVNKIINV